MWVHTFCKIVTLKKKKGLNNIFANHLGRWQTWITPNKLYVELFLQFSGCCFGCLGEHCDAVFCCEAPENVLRTTKLHPTLRQHGGGDDDWMFLNTGATLNLCFSSLALMRSVVIPAESQALTLFFLTFPFCMLQTSACHIHYLFLLVGLR